MTLLNKICVDCEKAPSRLPKLIVCSQCEKKWNELPLIPRAVHAFNMLAKALKMEKEAKDKDND